jgi:Uma2 family endonuclease
MLNFAKIVSLLTSIAILQLAATAQANPIKRDRTNREQPLIIIEVLSSSTNNKFLCYRSIPSFKEYILIDQYSYFIEHFAKTEDNKWLLTEYETEDARLVFNFIDFEISLQDIYARFDFNEE